MALVTRVTDVKVLVDRKADAESFRESPKVNTTLNDITKNRETTTDFFVVALFLCACFHGCHGPLTTDH
jgi:hypothetical protein